MHFNTTFFFVAAFVLLALFWTLFQWAIYTEKRNNLSVAGALGMWGKELFSIFFLFAITYCTYLFLGNWGVVFIFTCISFWVLRDYLTIAPTKGSDHFTLFWSLFAVTIVQYLLIGFNLFNAFSIFIPVYCAFLIPISLMFSGNKTKYLERATQINFGLLICVYGLSHIPAILNLSFPEDVYVNKFSLICYLVLITQISDMLFGAISTCLSKHPIAPGIDVNRTWEGAIITIVATTFLGMVFFQITPFNVGMASICSLVIVLASIGSTLCVSTIKRDFHERNDGTNIDRYGMLLERMDSLAFSAPVFYHLVSFYINYYQ